MNPEAKERELDRLMAEIQAVLAGKRSPHTIAPYDAIALTVSPSQTLAQVRTELGDCQRCNLCKTRKNIVFGRGNPSAHLLIIGEAPGEQEDRTGEPFVGRAGELLEKMLTSVLGLTSEEVYIANVIKCRPPDNRDPDSCEVSACLPFLQDQIRIIAPKVLLLMGSIATKAVLQSEHGVTRMRGQWHEAYGIPTYATFHPANLLRQERNKVYAFEDLKAVEEKIRASKSR
jgi:DNA polymerase